MPMQQADIINEMIDQVIYQLVLSAACGFASARDVHQIAPHSSLPS
jgi:hypothetical protein